MERKYIPYIILVALGVFLITVGIQDILADRREAAEARDEYEMLYTMFSGQTRETVQPPDTFVTDDPAETIDNPEDMYPTLDELYAMNNDFIGWFSIKGLIEYPVVQGRDNEKYINTTFLGARNSAGTIFMDYRHKNKWDDEVCVLYGHRSYDGSMFAPLERYLNPQYLQRNSTLTITTPDGNTLTYAIFAAKETDAWDRAYEAAFTNPSGASETFPNAPDNATHFLILSTCTRSPDPDERILVFAAKVE